jgi:tRNA A37 threonylcarbamoyladenosine modification protein TsaB
MILIISTEKNTHFSVGLSDGQGISQYKTVRKKYQQSELLLVTIDLLLETSKVRGIVVVKGPGDFSALRIGVSTANGLSYAWQIPVVGVKLNEKMLALKEKQKLAEVLQLGQELLSKYKPRSRVSCVLPEYDQEPNIG